MKKTLFNILSNHWLIQDEVFNSFAFSIHQYINSGIEIDFATTEKTALVAKSFVASNFSAAAKGSRPHSGSQYVGIVSLKGALMKSDTWCAYGMNSIAAELDRLKSDEQCIGAILDTDSPGGTVDGTPNLSRAVADFGKPIIAYVDGCAASAAYWIASQCDKIFLNDALDQVGSIGVAFNTMDVTPVLEKQGVKVFNLVADESPNKNKAIFDLFKKGDDKLIKAQMSEIYAAFKAAVISKREGIAEDCINGHMYFAPKAIEYKMVDGIKSMNECIQEVINMHNESSESGHNSHDKNNNKVMSMKQFAVINAALGVEALEHLDGYVSLDEKGLSAIADAIAVANKSAEDSKVLLDAANKRISELEAAQKTAEEEHDKALSAANAQIKALKESSPAKRSTATSKGELNAEDKDDLESLNEEMDSMTASERTEFLKERLSNGTNS